MYIKRYKIFRPIDVFTYIILMGLIPTLLIAWAFVSNKNLPLASIISMSLTLTTFYTIISIVFLWRFKFAKSISYYTDTGVAVIIKDRKVTDQIKAIVDSTIRTTVRFFGVDTFPGTVYDIEDYFNGGILTISAEKPYWIDPNSGIKRFALGLTLGNIMAVSWPQDTEFPTALLRHEAGHVALNAIKIGSYDSSSQHATFYRTGWRY